MYIQKLMEVFMLYNMKTFMSISFILFLITVLFACNTTSGVKDDPELNEKLVSAAMNNDIKTVKSLVKKGADVNYYYMENTPLTMAVSMNNYDIVEFLLESGADPDLRISGGETSLMIAVGKGFPILTGLILKYNPGLDLVDDSGYTALMKGAMMNQKECCVFLLEAGADKTIKNEFGFTALSFAENNGNETLASIIRDF